MPFLDAALMHAAMVEQWMLCTVDDIPDEQWADQPNGLTNHPAWVVGHLVVAFDNVTTKLGETVKRDEAWNAPYLPGSAPTSNRSDYPLKEELIESFRDAASGLRRTVLRSSPEKLSASIDDEQRAPYFPTIDRWMVHCLLFEPAFHAGQLSAWRRAKGMQPMLEVEGSLARIAAEALVV
jgi:hypothetical protein